MKKKILAIMDILLPIVLFILIEFFEINDYFIDIITLTLVIGWLFPFFINIITGITWLKKSHQKLAFYSNILSFILCMIILSYLITLYNRSFVYPIFLYSVLGILHIINITIYIIENKKAKSEELKEIKKLKQENKGIMK